MLKRSLYFKFSLLIACVLLLSASTTAIAVWGTNRTAKLMTIVIQENVASVRAAEELEIALLLEHRAIIAFLLDEGKSTWVVELENAREDFGKWMAEARRTGNTPEEQQILSRIDKLYSRYEEQRERALALYRTEGLESAKRVALDDLLNLYHQAYTLGEEYLAANNAHVQAAKSLAEAQVRTVEWIVICCFALTAVAGGMLLLLFYRTIVLPLRTIVEETRAFSAGEYNDEGQAEELHSIGEYLRTVMNSMSTELAQQQLKLGESERKLASVGRLAASLAHEIRNPLNSMNLAVQQISKTAAGEEEKRRLDLVKDEISRLDKIVRNFLEFSRPPLIHLTPGNIGEIVRKTEELLCEEIQSKGIRLTTEEAIAVPPVLVDAEQLRQVLINLLRNAVEATKEGGQIRVSAAVEDVDGRKTAVVRVKDSGTGMSEDVQARIFEPFFTTKGGGTGLGLAVAARIMEQHGGGLRIISSGPTGTVFALWLRLAE